MLGRLRMSVEQCKKAYINLAEDAFTKKNLISQIKEKASIGPQFKTKPLENAIRTIIGAAHENWKEALLQDKRPECKVSVVSSTEFCRLTLPCFRFVVALLQNITEPVILRSYRNLLKSRAS